MHQHRIPVRVHGCRYYCCYCHFHECSTASHFLVYFCCSSVSWFVQTVPDSLRVFCSRALCHLDAYYMRWWFTFSFSLHFVFLTYPTSIFITKSGSFLKFWCKKWSNFHCFWVNKPFLVPNVWVTWNISICIGHIKRLIYSKTV